MAYPFQDMLYYLLPLLFMFGLFMAGFYFAWTDFKPRRITEKDYEDFRYSNLTQMEPVVRDRELTLRELGIEDIDNTAALPMEEQRRLSMDKMMREYSIENPEEVANIVKSWLKEK